MTKLIPVSEVHKFDEDRLAKYLTSVGLNEFENGLEKKGEVLCIKRPWDNEYKRLKKLQMIKVFNARFFVNIYIVGWVQDSCQAPKLIPGHPLA